MSKGRVCLAYSGGLDTSTILVWLIQQGYSVVAFIGNVGQEEDFAAVEAKALKLGAEAFVVADLQRELVDEVVSRAIMCNAIYEDEYLLGTALARPVIARAQVKAAMEHQCDFVSHGCTGKGNDQVRFELAFAALNPNIRVLAPWRIPEFIERFKGRNDLLAFAKDNNIPVSQSPKAPWSMDDNIVHCSYEAGILEAPDCSPPAELWTRTVDPVKAPDQPEEFSVHFEKGLIKKVVRGNQEETDSVEAFKLLNKIGARNGVGRIDIVENRFIGLKSRGCYDTPGLTLARRAHLAVEGISMDGAVRALRDQFVTPTWSRLLYNGYYFSFEREFIENSVVYAQQTVTGVVRMAAFKGHCYVLGRTSPSNLYSADEASMDSLDGFDVEHTTGFIHISGIRLKKYGSRKLEEGEPLTK